ncbi:DNA-directed RNA polymerase sigma-70 factor [Planotetraspora silvatica]|uniref:DNA-directed RNA polymerase sigma-70 factor n=1 Tax=Planotetraspora silvatica TaxID=234614 RepID=A0A8J3US14_9ACTN|nr:RNA polymerase sigma factor [Planotetraspora silvatica]GII50303.1 DNA-directed RNA polymerase sigma-70 factor [Planotetraspora silvatica]
MRRAEAQTAEVAGELGDVSAGPTDAEIIGLSGREPERFADIFDRYYAEIYGYVERRLGPSMADDVAAETFLIAFDRRGRFDTAHSTARPWLYGIASNLISRHHRAETRHYRALTRVGPPGAVDGPADRIVGRVVAESNRGRLAAALAAISQGDRDVLLLVAWAGLTGEEAARALDIPSGTARSRLHRARKKIRAALGGIDPTTIGEDA